MDFDRADFASIKYLQSDYSRNEEKLARPSLDKKKLSADWTGLN
jgi:hypothetical protein